MLEHIPGNLEIIYTTTIIAKQIFLVIKTGLRIGKIYKTYLNHGTSILIFVSNLASRIMSAAAFVLLTSSHVVRDKNRNFLIYLLLLKTRAYYFIINSAW